MAKKKSTKQSAGTRGKSKAGAKKKSPSRAAASRSKPKAASRSVKKKPTAKQTPKKTTTAKKKAVVKKAAGSKKQSAAKKPTSKKKAPTAKKKAVAGTKPARKAAAASANAPAVKKAAPRPATPPVYRPGPAAREELPELTPAQLRKVKTGLTKRDREKYRKLLLEKRAEIVGDVMTMQTARAGNGAEASHMPLHMADVGSDNYEQEFTLGLMESERKLLREIDDALMRLRDGTYGVCHDMGVPIGKARLEAKPWAKYCIEAARQREARRF